ncbi:hypothetical protein DKG77_06095 [Flagellimonas aquimarina]|uniref:Uncharacterized protein n=1 Tax=Flagellimonas aquimarina TaxID=2201895 RepID=A0A316L631_9FLAO|nr:hypothetical protein [Allomuricauda koreensis]PWL40385.1 hypothetical protein DKG77_06095 [Allomuricauda koreensis]
MKWWKKVLFVLLIIIGLLLVLGTWYKNKYAMEMVMERTVNRPELNRSLVIATQGSAFKDSITFGIINHFESDSLFIRIIDVSGLAKVNLDDYDAMVLMHTWENWKPPMAVGSFVDKLKIEQKNKIVVLTTSGEGSSKIEEIDAITGESILENVPAYTEKIISELEQILRPKDN